MKNKQGISLIVLIITIIVIIILAAAVIISLDNNNPIDEADRARYESDCASMQALLTNTISKIMTKNLGTLSVMAGQINSITEGEIETTGEIEYTVADSAISSNKNGKIVFDKGENTDTIYYTGKKLPVYALGETRWFVDTEGIISLQVAGIEYGQGEISKWRQNKTIVSKTNPDGTIVTLEVGDTIATEDTFDTSIHPAWRVLGAEDGKLLLTIKYWKTVNLTGKEGFFAGSQSLDELSQSIVTVNDAVEEVRSIKVEDLNRVTGYDPMKTGEGVPYKNGVRGMYGEKVTYYFKDGVVASKSSLGEATDTYTAFQHIDGRILVPTAQKDEANKKVDTIKVECNNYTYYPKTLTTTKEGTVVGIDSSTDAYKFLFGGTKYWLASSFVHTGKGGVSWGLRFVDSTTSVTGTGFFDSAYDTEKGTSAIVLPVVKLNEKCVISEDETGSYNWKIEF